MKVSGISSFLGESKLVRKTERRMFFQPWIVSDIDRLLTN